jgi:hypothetical protein
MTDKSTYIDQLLTLPVDSQFKIAERLASNCGYKLIGEETEQSIHAKIIISRLADNGPAIIDEGDRELIRLGLEKLL